MLKLVGRRGEVWGVCGLTSWWWACGEVGITRGSHFDLEPMGDCEEVRRYNEVIDNSWSYPAEISFRTHCLDSTAGLPSG